MQCRKGFAKSAEFPQLRHFTPTINGILRDENNGAKLTKNMGCWVGVLRKVIKKTEEGIRKTEEGNRGAAENAEFAGENRRAETGWHPLLYR